MVCTKFIVLVKPQGISGHQSLLWSVPGLRSELKSDLRQLREIGGRGGHSNSASLLLFSLLLYKKINLMSNSLENSPLLCVCF